MEKIEFYPGSVVKSLAGRDAGKIYLVIETAGRDFVLIADGKKRPLSNPKLKRVKHLKLLSEGGGLPAGLGDGAVIYMLRKFEGGLYA